MALHLQSTIFGQAVRMISRNGRFKYPDETDPSLWKTAYQREHSPELNPSQESCERQHNDGPIDGSGMEKNRYGAPREEFEKAGHSNSPTSDPSDVVVVGWYGPDDPEASHFAVLNTTSNP